MSEKQPKQITEIYRIIENMTNGMTARTDYVHRRIEILELIYAYTAEQMAGIVPQSNISKNVYPDYAGLHRKCVIDEINANIEAWSKRGETFEVVIEGGVR